MTVRKFQGFLHYRGIIEELKLSEIEKKNYRDLNHFVSTGIHQWWIQGRGSGAPYFWAKLRPEESKKNFWRPPPPYLRVWMTAPPFPYLKVWIRLCSCHLYILLTTLKGLQSSRHQTISPPTKSPPRSQLATY